MTLDQCKKHVGRVQSSKSSIYTSSQSLLYIGPLSAQEPHQSQHRSLQFKVAYGQGPATDAMEFAEACFKSSPRQLHYLHLHLHRASILVNNNATIRTPQYLFNWRYISQGHPRSVILVLATRVLNAVWNLGRHVVVAGPFCAGSAQMPLPSPPIELAVISRYLLAKFLLFFGVKEESRSASDGSISVRAFAFFHTSHQATWQQVRR